MKIGELSRLTGASTRSLRYYEAQQLLTSKRSSGGTRWYNADACDRVQLIQELYAVGLSSAKILALLPEVHPTATTADEIAQLHAERDEVNQNIQKLIEARDRLAGLIIAKQLQLRITESRAA